MRNSKCVFCSTSIGSAASHRGDYFRQSARSIGLCDECYSVLMNEPIPGDSSFGKMVSKCRACGTSVYEKDKGSCPICKTAQAV